LNKRICVNTTRQICLPCACTRATRFDIHVYKHVAANVCAFARFVLILRLFACCFCQTEEFSVYHMLCPRPWGHFLSPRPVSTVTTGKHLWFISYQNQIISYKLFCTCISFPFLVD